MTTQTNGIEQSIQEKEDLTAKLQGLKAKRGGLMTQKHGLINKLIDARRAVNGYPEDKPEYDDLRKEAQMHLDSLLGQDKSFEDELQVINAEIEGIESKLGKLSTSASVEQLFEFIKKIKKAEADLKSVDEKIEHQQQLINSLHDVSDDQLTTLQQKRTTLLADIYLEIAQQSELDQLDAEIEELVNKSSLQHFKDHPIKRDASQLIQGLLPHKQAAENHLAQLKATLPNVLELFLIGQSEEIAKQYLKASQTLIDNYYKLQALDKLRQDMGLIKEGVACLNSPVNQLTIPSMDLKVFSDIEQDNAVQHILFTENKDFNVIEAILASSKEQINQNFEKLGVNQVFEMLNQ